MDEDDRRELGDLRRRAYGPGDGLSDPADLARLSDLEAAVRREREPKAPEPEPVDEPDPVATTGRRRWILPAVIAAAVVVTGAIVLPRLAEEAPTLRRTTPGPFSTPTGILATPPAALFAQRFAEDADTETLLSLHLLAAFDDEGPPPQPPVPGFPVDGELRWVDVLGEYHGAEVWRARAESGDLCLLIALPTISRSTCMSEAEFDLDAMLVVARYLEVPESERPDAMVAGDALAFWWRSDDRFEVLLGRSPHVLD